MSHSTVEASAGLDLTPITQRSLATNDIPFGPTSLATLRASANDVPALIDEIVALRHELRTLRTSFDIYVARQAHPENTDQ